MIHIQPIICPEFQNLYFVGRNYVEHIEELKNEQPEHPLFFIKPVSCANHSGHIGYPAHTNSLHFEGEMVFVLPGSFEKLTENGQVLVGCGIDFTARDVQARIKEKGWPWFEAKCFRGSAIISDTFIQVPLNLLSELTIETWINGERRQHGCYSQTIFSLPDLVRHLESLVEIRENDILFTGTPSGVGTVHVQDKIQVLLLLNGSKLTEVICEVT